MGNCFVECQGSENLAAIRASTILITAASLTIVTDNAPLFGTSPINSQASDLVIGYHQSTTENSERFLPVNGAFLHVGHVNISDSLLALFRFCIKRIGFGHCFNESLGPIRSVILSTGGEGPYSFPAWIGNVSGDLIASDGRETFSIDSNYSFVDVLSFPPSPSCYFTRSAPVLDSITLLKKSIAFSADVFGPAEGDAATRIILIAIACFVLLLIIGAIVLVLFRRRRESLKDSEGGEIEGQDSLTLVPTTVNGGFDPGHSGGPEVM
jgi:hypothetical protein